MRIFLDANILFSAARADGAVRQLLRLLQQAGHVLVADIYVATEARRNLLAKEAAQGVEALEQLLTVVQVGTVHQRADMTDALTAWLPAKDRPVLASAMLLECDVLVTGDRTHFGPGYGKAFGPVTVYSPAQTAQALLDAPT